MTQSAGYQTGYFGVPGKVGGIVHVVYDGKPVCGARMNPKARFVSCVNGIAVECVECRRCKTSAAVKESSHA